jgi:RimJ/RimL family protein N-acetyltransferase
MVQLSDIEREYMKDTVSFNDLENISLQNDQISISRYQSQDYADLEAIFVSDIFQFFTRKYSSCEEFINDRLTKYSQKELICFVVRDLINNTLVGSFSLINIQLPDKTIEIGAIWFGKDNIGKFYNSMTNLLLLEHLFEVMQFNRVQWKTDTLNIVSQQAARSLGFVYEGILRKHLITESGRVRDTIMFSIIDEEWQFVKLKLLQKVKDKLDDNRM